MWSALSYKDFKLFRNMIGIYWVQARPNLHNWQVSRQGFYLFPLKKVKINKKLFATVGGREWSETGNREEKGCFNLKFPFTFELNVSESDFSTSLFGFGAHMI
jgi:hypothetical protein